MTDQYSVSFLPYEIGQDNPTIEDGLDLKPTTAGKVQFGSRGEWAYWVVKRDPLAVWLDDKGEKHLGSYDVVGRFRFFCLALALCNKLNSISIVGKPMEGSNNA